MLKKVMIVFAVLLGIVGCLSKPEPRTGDFNAAVIDSLTGEGIPGVKVDIGSQQLETNLKGQFSLAGFAPGEYQVKMERGWYQSKEISYNHLGKSELVEFYLLPEEELSGRIIYSLDKSGNRDLYLLDLGSREISAIIDLPDSDETNPCWISQDEIAFQSNLAEDSEVIQFLNMTNQSIETFGKGEHPSLDLTGTIMVYKSSDNIITKYNRTSKESTTYGLAGFNPVISPDGTMTAYTSGNRESINIYIEGSKSKFTPGGGFKVANPCWSPDSTRIAFEAYTDGDGQRAIYYIQVVPALSATMQQITFPSASVEQHCHPTWPGTPDNPGDMIYFSANIIYTSRNDIYAVRLGDDPEWILISKGSGSKDYPCWGL